MKFNKKKVAALSLAGLLALGGIATASAFIIDDAKPENGNVGVDTALELKWGEGTTATVNATDLSPTKPFFGQVSATYRQSTSVGQVGVINFELNETTLGESKYIHVTIQNAPFALDSQPTYTKNLDALNTTVQSATFDNTSETYYFKITLEMPEGKAVASDPAGTLTISLASVVANA